MKILVYGAFSHLTDDYSEEEKLHYYKFIAEQAEKLNIDCLIGLGNFRAYNYTDSMMRETFIRLLKRLSAQTKGEHYELFDKSKYPIEEFYIEAGLIKPASKITDNNIVIDMWESGKPASFTYDAKETVESGVVERNIILFNDFLYFKGFELSGYANAYIIEDLPDVKSVSWLIGSPGFYVPDRINKINENAVCNLFYPKAMPNPKTGEKASFVLIDTTESKNYIQIKEFETLDVEKPYDIIVKNTIRNKHTRRQELQMVTEEFREAIKNIAPNGYRRSAYEIISENKQISPEIRNKALEYLKSVNKYTLY